MGNITAQNPSSNNQPSKQANISTPVDLLQKNNYYYGGKRINNPNTKTTYQQFYIDEKHLQSFLSLINSRKSLNQKIKQKTSLNSGSTFSGISNYWIKHQSRTTTSNLSSATGSNNIYSCQPATKKKHICVEYPLYQRNLADLLEQQAAKGIPFTEHQLMQIFVPLLECLQLLEQQGTCHGDIKPSNIHMVSLSLDPTPKPKLLDCYFINGGKTSYELIMQNPSSMSFLSPEQLQRLNDKQFDSFEDIHSNEMFSVGLCMYECMTFEHAMECYDLDKLRIKKGFFAGKEHVMYRHGYNSVLVEAVLDGILLRKAKEGRLGYREMLDLLVGKKWGWGQEQGTLRWKCEQRRQITKPKLLSQKSYYSSSSTLS